MTLIGQLPGMEAARKAIDDQIAEIHRQIARSLVAPDSLRREPAPSSDSTTLGREVLGRIKRKRHLSPEVREAKRKLIAAARQKKFDNLRAAAGQKSGTQPPQPPSDTAAGEKEGQK